MLRTVLPLLLLAGCPMDAPIGTGTLEICTDAGGGGDDVDVELSGTVVALDDDGACSRSVAVDDGSGAIQRFGLTVTDGDGEDVTPAFDLAEGDAIDLIYRYRLVWGDVAGLAVSDGDGLVLAAEQGTWGGALQDDDVPGLTVARGDQIVGREATDCEPLEGYALRFEADETLELVPVDQGALSLDGSPLTAIAVAALEWGDARGCETTDTTGHATWVVAR